MATVFEKIIAGDIPGRFVWADPDCVAFATIEPHTPGHVLVVPRQAVADFWDADPELFAHLSQVCQAIAGAQIEAFKTARVGQVIAGFDVPHLHIHLIPMNSTADLDTARAKPAQQEQLDAAMQQLREALVIGGYADFVPNSIFNCELDEDSIFNQDDMPSSHQE